MSLSSHRALITGASRGLGLSIAHLFSSHGATVTLTGRSSSTLETALSSLPRPTDQPHQILTGDVGDSKFWEEGVRGIYVSTSPEGNLKMERWDWE